MGKGGQEKEKMHMTSRQMGGGNGGSKGVRRGGGCCSPLCLQSNKQHQFITHERKKNESTKQKQIRNP